MHNEHARFYVSPEIAPLAQDIECMKEQTNGKVAVIPKVPNEVATPYVVDYVKVVEAHEEMIAESTRLSTSCFTILGIPDGEKRLTG